MAREISHLVATDLLLFVESIDQRTGDADLLHPGPPRTRCQLRSILLSFDTDRGCFDSKWQILAHQNYALTFIGEIACNREDPGIVRSIATESAR
ncbi:unannotated protein [freshwater metagenome]|uniref:Unannotated protein n=1 Tax=freshwater metagenome TaxID=449393 RepID=A0A6J6E5S8_9ZZZZ